MNPYIGITDFASIEQVLRMQRVFQDHLPVKSDRVLHIGVMMNRKTLNGLESKWAEVFVPKEQIRRIFTCGATYNCLHYADMENIDVMDNISRALSYGGEGMDGLQLDMVWPPITEVLRALEKYGRKIEVILQVSGRAMDQCKDDPVTVAKKVSLRSSFVDRVLLDKSMGQGKGMDALALLPYIRAIKDQMPDVGIVVAGGLGPDTLHLLEPVLEEFPDVSIDAQGKMRRSGSSMDPIDWDIAEQYLINAIKLLA